MGILLGVDYGKCSKISKALLFLSSDKVFVFRAGIYKRLYRVVLVNREDPDPGSALFVKTFLAGNKRSKF